MMNHTHLSTSDVQKGRFFQIPGSLLKGAMSFGKSLVTWEGRDVSHLDDAEFLRKGCWEENLKLLSTITSATTTKAFMTKNLYRWHPKETFIAEGFSSSKNQKNAIASQAYLRWLQIGTIAGIAYFFFKTMQFNFNCLNELDEKECNILYGAAISHPATIAKIVFAVGTWALGGWLLNHLSDFGLLGFIKERKLNQDLILTYRTTADSIRTAFWNAVDNKDEIEARKIYKQVQSIKNSSAFLKNSMFSLLGASENDKDKEKILQPFNSFYLLIEDLLTQNIDALLSPQEIKEETTVETCKTQDNTLTETPKSGETKE